MKKRTLHSKIGFILTIIAIIGQVKSVKIVSLSVPSVVPANATEVVLDCDYSIEEWERTGLVLKWYVDSLQLVYQWIPPTSPRALGLLSNRVDTSYTASNLHWKRHRALFIRDPDPGLSGTYSCVVSTFEDEDIKTAPMLVWSPPKYVKVHYWRTSEYLVNITCLVDDVAPSPKITLYIRDPNGSRSDIDIRGGYEYHKDKVWRTSQWGLIVWSETAKDSIIGCHIQLPNTSHSENRETIYHPDLPIITTTTTTTTEEPQIPPIRITNPSSNLIHTTHPSPFGVGFSLSSCRDISENIVNFYLIFCLWCQYVYIRWRRND